MENTAYTLRGLNADDLFDVIRIVNKIGLREVKKCFAAEDLKKMLNGMKEEGNEEEGNEEEGNEEEGNENEITVAVVGLSVIMDVASLVLEHLPECKSDLYRLLSNLSGMQETEIAALPAGTFFGMIMDVLKHPSFNDFFQQLVGLFK